MTTVTQDMLKMVADLDALPRGAYNIRVNGKSEARESTKSIRIVPKENASGIDIYVAPFTKQETVHIPVVIDASGFTDLVYNDFHIGEGSDVLIIAGCGIHNDDAHLSQHDGIHTFYLEKNAKVKYVEKHYGNGEGTGLKVLNPVTIIHQDAGSIMEMETVQIEGVDNTDRVTTATLADYAKVIIKEALMTSGAQTARTEYTIDINGTGASVNVMSRSVAKGTSRQAFYSKVNGNSACAGHSECDAIIMDDAVVKAVPEITANHVDASLIHEAAIGKIAGEQITKLMTLGLSQEDAEQEIVSGFLK